MIPVLIALLLIAGCVAQPTATPTSIPPTASPTATVVPPTATPTVAAGGVTQVQIAQGFGAKKGFWEVYFTAPTGSRDASTYTGGIDQVLAADLA